MSSSEINNRREVKTRSSSWAQKSAVFLTKKGVSPDLISIFSIVFSFGSLISFIQASENKYFLILSVIFIQLRLICNLLDGMIAVEFNRKSIHGELFNEIPDRISDFLIIIGAGLFSIKLNYAMDLAWANVFLSTFVSYLRTFGAALTKKHFFLGPMAKQHRMFLLSVSSIASLWINEAIYWSLLLMLLFLIVTAYNRILAISKELKSRA